MTDASDDSGNCQPSTSVGSAAIADGESVHADNGQQEGEGVAEPAPAPAPARREQFGDGATIFLVTGHSLRPIIQTAVCDSYTAAASQACNAAVPAGHGGQPRVCSSGTLPPKPCTALRKVRTASLVDASTGREHLAQLHSHANARVAAHRGGGSGHQVADYGPAVRPAPSTRHCRSPHNGAANRQVLVSMPCRRWRALECASTRLACNVAGAGA